MLDFAALSAQVMEGMSDDGDDSSEGSPDVVSGPTAVAGEAGGVEGDKSFGEGVNSLLSNLIASQAASTSTAAVPAPKPAVVIDPVLESLAASLASTPVVSPQMQSPAQLPPAPQPKAGSSSASTETEKRPAPTPNVFEPRTYSTELPQFTASPSALSARALEKQPQRPTARPSPAKPAAPRVGQLSKKGPSSRAPLAQQARKQQHAAPVPPAGRSINYAQDLDELQTMQNGEPPNYPWWAIIRAAIIGSPWGALTKQEIVKAVLAKWPAFHKRGENLGKAITYNLRSKACFIRCRMKGQGRTSFYIVDSTMDGSKPKLQPPTRGKNKQPTKPVYTHRFSPSVAAARNSRTGQVPAFLPSRPATTATPDAVQQAVQAALSQLTGQAIVPPPLKPLETCRAQGPNLIARMRFANGENSDDDPDLSDVDNVVSSDEEGEEEEDEEEEVPDGGESGPRPSSSLTAIAGPGAPGSERRKGGLGSSLAAITGGPSGPSRYAGRSGATATSARIASTASRAVAPAYPSLDAQIAATLAGVISMGADDSDSDSSDEDEDHTLVAVATPDPASLASVAGTAPEGNQLGLDLSEVDFQAMQKEIEMSTGDSDSDSDESDEGAEPLDINAVLGRAIAQASSKGPLPTVDDSSATADRAPTAVSPPPAANKGTKRTADDAGLDAGPTSALSALSPSPAIAPSLAAAAPAASTATDSAPDQATILNMLHDIVNKAGESAKVEVPKELPALLSAALASSGFTFTGSSRSVSSAAGAAAHPAESSSSTEHGESRDQSPMARLNGAITAALTAHQNQGTQADSTTCLQSGSKPALASADTVVASAPAPPPRVPAPPIIGRMPVPGRARPAVQTSRVPDAPTTSSPGSAVGQSSRHSTGDRVDADGLGRYDKPKATYPELAREAINSVPDKQLTAADIFQIIEERYPYFVDAPEGWRATLRNVLTSHSCFTKVPRPTEAPGRGDFWTVVEVPTWKRKRITAKAKQEERGNRDGSEGSPRARPVGQPSKVVPTPGPLQQRASSHLSQTPTSSLPSDMDGHETNAEEAEV